MKNAVALTINQITITFILESDVLFDFWFTAPIISTTDNAGNAKGTVLSKAARDDSALYTKPELKIILRTITTLNVTNLALP